MAGVLLESVGAGGGLPLGFGKAGIGFGWGNGSPLHTWELLGGGGFFGGVGHANMSFGGFGQNWPGLPQGDTIVTAGIVDAAIDYINQDQSDWAVSRLCESYGNWSANLANQLRDCYLYTGGGFPGNPIPVMLGGTAVTTAVGAIFPGYNGDPTDFPQSFYDSGTGNTAVTGVGFEPDLVVFFNATSNTAPMDGLRVTVGMMDAAGNQWTCAEIGIFDTAGTNIGGLFGYPVRSSEFRSDACIVALNDPFGAFSAPQDYSRSSFVSMDPDGFTIHADDYRTTLGGYRSASLWMAYKVDDPTKAFFQVGTHVQGDTSLGTYPLDPECVILVGDSWSPNPAVDAPAPPVWTDATVSTRAVFSAGGFDAVTNRSTVGGCGSGGGNNPGQYYDDSAIVFGNPSAQVILARALGSIAPLTANLSWTDDDGGLRPFGSLAFRVPNRGFPMLDHRLPYGVAA